MTISSTNRRAGPYSGNSSQTAFPFSFKVFEAADMLVVKVEVATNIETTLTLTTDYTVSLNADQNSNAGGTINLVTALPTGYNMVISSKVAYLQETDLTNQGGFYPEVITDALDRLTIEAQQLKEGLDRAAQLPITSDADAAALVADIERIASSADNLDTVATNITAVNTVATNITNVNTVAGISSNVTTVAGISANVTTVAGISSNVTSVAGNATNINAVANNATNINAVNANKTNIDAVAGNATNINSVNSNSTNINTCATNISAIIDAPTQAANAANSAAAAAASAASGMYSGVQDKSANYTVVAADAGDLIRVTTTSGAVTITLPLIGSTGITDGFKIAVVKWTSDANAVNIARSGSNTINGATSAQIGSQYSQIIFVADAETSTWFASQTGLGATNINVDVFSGNASTTAFTLTSDPSSKNNTYVSISGVYQAKSTYSVSGTTLTFSTAPPTGTSNIEVVYGTPLAIGTPSDGTVTTSKLADSNVTPAKLDRQYVVQDSSTGAAQMPSGTTAQRPASPVAGQTRWNTTLSQYEVYTGSSWASLVGLYYSIDSLVVAGGASGGSVGGGGAGGYISSSSLSITAGATYTITIGAGGAASTVAAGNNGSNSVFSGSGITTQTAIGGGAGNGGNAVAGLSGGSGGGGGADSTGGAGGAGTSGQGYAGGAGSGNGSGTRFAGGAGGGASAVGGDGSSATTGGVGGAGANWQSLGTLYAGGGGGGAYILSGTGTLGAGGSGGGGSGGANGTNSVAGTANTGGGGGGRGLTSAGTAQGSGSGAGGSGIVIIRYAGVQRGIGGTITQSGGYTYHTFTSSGTYTA